MKVASRIWQEAYWQVRVRYMCDPLIRKHMSVNHVSRIQAEHRMFKWISKKINNEVVSFTIMTVGDCRAIIPILHRLNSKKE